MPLNENRRLIRIAFDARTDIRINRFYEQVNAVAVEAITNSLRSCLAFSLSLFLIRMSRRIASCRLLSSRSFRWNCLSTRLLAKSRQIGLYQGKKNDHPDAPEKRICSKTARYTIEATNDLLRSMIQ